VSSSQTPHPYTADEALSTWDSIKDTPPRDPPNLNGHGAHPQGPPTYTESDDGNGQRLLDECGENLRYVEGRTYPWHVWDGTCWAPDREQWVAQRMAHIMRAALAAVAGNAYVPRHQLQGQARWLTASLDAGKINAALRSASRAYTVKHDVFDQQPWLVPCANGLTYDLAPDAPELLRASRREDLMSRCLPVAASREPVAHPTWDAVLDLVMDGDHAMVRYLRQVLGLLLTGDVSEQCFWFWFGKGKNGKSTLATFLHTFLGDYACKLALRALLERREAMAIRHDLAELQGRRLAYTEEFKPGDVLNAGTIKDITGGGKITADRKGEQNETFAATAKLIIATNDLPSLHDVDEAIRSRVRCIPFTVHIPTKLGNQTHSVAEVVAALMEEAPGILQDLVAAVLEWRASGSKLVMPAAVQAATKEYLDEQDPLVAWMETCCEPVGSGTSRPREERPFAEWYWSFRIQSGRSERQATPHWFGKQLEQHKFAKRQTARGPLYTGPKLMPEAAKEAWWAANEDAERKAKYGR
jgi:putative DNA primase/helicase